MPLSGPSDPTSAAESSASLTSRLSPALLGDAATRVSWLGLVTAILLLGNEVFHQLAQPVMASMLLRDPVIRLTTLTTVIAGIGLFALHRYQRAPDWLVVRLGMAFAVLVAFDIGIIETHVPIDPEKPVVGISAIGPWIVAVGAFIPNRPISTLITGLVMASMYPLAYGINFVRLPLEPVRFGTLLVWPGLIYLMAGLAWLISRRTYGTAVEAQAAHELGSYRLESPIGEGGMGEIWKASHQMLARSAAIKLIKPEMLAIATGQRADVAIKRFKREANIIANLQSPHTVLLYDFGVAQDGRCYCVMELLDGISLQTLVTHFGPQPASRVGAILRQVCESLEEAHTSGLMHRDLKPSNVMLCRVGLTYDFVKVLDFGLAKHAGRSHQQTATQLTMEGVASGTPGYMAPEVAMGSADIDARVDIYALGCVAYFLLTGTLVFVDDNPMALALKHVQAAPDPPSLRTEMPIPADLERLVMRCLEKRPADRPSSAREVAALIAGCQLPPWTTEDIDHWWAQHLPATSSLRTFAQTPASTPPRVVRRG